MERWAAVGVMALVNTFAVLLTGSISICAEDAVAVFSRLPATDGTTPRVATRPAPGASDPTFMFTPPPNSEKEPEGLLLETKVTPGGKVSVKITPVAVLGPTLVKVSR